MFWIAHARYRLSVNAVHQECSPAFHDHLLPAPDQLARLLRDTGLDEVEIEDDADHFLTRAVRLAPAVASVHLDNHA